MGFRVLGTEELGMVGSSLVKKFMLMHEFLSSSETSWEVTKAYEGKKYDAITYLLYIAYIAIGWRKLGASV